MTAPCQHVTTDAQAVVDDVRPYVYDKKHAGEQVTIPRSLLRDLQQCALALAAQQARHDDVESLRRDTRQAQRDRASMQNQLHAAQARLGTVLELAEQRGLPITDGDVTEHVREQERANREVQDRMGLRDSDVTGAVQPVAGEQQVLL